MHNNAMNIAKGNYGGYNNNNYSGGNHGGNNNYNNNQGNYNQSGGNYNQGGGYGNQGGNQGGYQQNNYNNNNQNRNQQGSRQNTYNSSYTDNNAVGSNSIADQLLNSLKALIREGKDKVTKIDLFNYPQNKIKDKVRFDAALDSLLGDGYVLEEEDILRIV
jgi:hypothetical protein